MVLCARVRVLWLERRGEWSGALSLRSFRALRPGGRLVVFGRYATLAHGRKNWPAVIEWYAATASVALWGLLSPRRRVLAYRIDKVRNRHQDWFREDFLALLELLRRGEIHPVVAERLPLSDARALTSCSSARRRRENSCSCRKPRSTFAKGARHPPFRFATRRQEAGRVRWRATCPSPSRA